MGRRLSSTLADMIRHEVRQVIRAELAPWLQESLQGGPPQGQGPGGQQNQPPVQQQAQQQPVVQQQPVQQQPAQQQPVQQPGGQEPGGGAAVAAGQLAVLEQAILDALVRQGALLMDSSRQDARRQDGGAQAGHQTGGQGPAGGQETQAGNGVGPGARRARQENQKANQQESQEHSGVIARLAHLLGLGTGGDGVQPAEDGSPGRGVPPVLHPEGYQDAGSSIGDTGGGAGGGVQSGQGGTGGPQTAADIYKEMEVNLLKLRQVIQESEALAVRLEKLLQDESNR